MAPIADHLFERLPTLAWYLTDDSWQNIDDPLEHEPDWHQWGVLEHTKRVWTSMMTDVPIYSLAWGLPFISELMTERISGKTKWDLLLIACIVHDLGKWAGRVMNTGGSHTFRGHAAMSEQLIRCDPFIRQSLLDAQLSPNHLDYVARVAGLHYELGKIRQLGHQQGTFNLASIATVRFGADGELAFVEHQDFAREIGLIFLADSLAKVEFRVDIQPLAEIEANIMAKGLSRNLIQAAYQVPLNIALCREYLVWLKEQATASREEINSC